MHQRIAVAFRGRCEDERAFFVLGQAERVVRPQRADLQCGNRQFEIIDRAGRRREMENVIDFLLRQKNEIGNVMLDEPVILVTGEMPDVRGVPGHQIVDRDDLVPLGNKRSVKCDPRNPAPPVTTDMGFFARFAISGLSSG